MSKTKTMVATGRSVGRGVRFCEQQIGSSAKPTTPTADGMTNQDMLTLLDLLFEHADLRDNDSYETVQSRLGDGKVELLLRYYNTFKRDGGDAVPLKEASTDKDEELPGSEISSNSDEDDAVSSLPPTPPKAQAYKADTEIAMNRIFQIGNVTPPEQPHIRPDEPYFGPNVVTMSGFGELGRFGNQVLQYAFLRCYAQLVGAEVQLPYWVGRDLFGLDDRPVQRALPAALECRKQKANSTFTDDFIQYISQSNGDGDVPEVLPEQLLQEKPPELVNVDFWGWFQWHTRHYAPYRELIQSLFEPKAALKRHFDALIDDKLRRHGRRTVVGCHLRLGDYKNIAASSFGYVAPTSWYLEWLEEIWPTLDNPVLFVASDQVDRVLRDFAKFNPVTAQELGADMPEEFQELKAGFFSDWYILSQCDVLAISNSTFSFTACLMNARPNARFFRAHYAQRMIEIDPWHAEPIVHREAASNALAAGIDTLRVLYNTQGAKATVLNLLYELPYYGVRSVIMRGMFRARALRKRLLATRHVVSGEA